MKEILGAVTSALGRLSTEEVLKAPSAAVGLAVAAALLAGCGSDDPPPPQTVPVEERGEPPGTAPNIVVVMTDDQTVGSFTAEAMPFTHRLFSERGVIASEAIASPPLCCPARAGFLTGQYAHNHGVTTNDPGYQQLVDPGNTLPVWLQRAGYRTALIGKFLGNYEAEAGAQPAPGWDRWYSIMGYAGYSGFEVSDDGVRTRPEGYATAVLAEQAADFIADSSGADEPPFFLWLALNAPHTVEAGSPPPCDVAAPQPESNADFAPFAEAPLPRPPSFDEDDVSDKGRWVSRRPPLDPERIAEMTTRWRCTLASLRSVDRGVETVIGELERSGELGDTLVVYLSDNGYFFGEHRIPEDKRLPYEPSLRIPMAFLTPDIEDPQPPALVSNVDLAPTFLDYAGAKPCADAAGKECRELDGISLRGVLGGLPMTPRRIPISLTESFAYDALRTTHHLYMELRADRDGPLDRPSAELYDLRTDPDQLDNLIATDREGSAVLRGRLAAHLDRLIDR